MFSIKPVSWSELVSPLSKDKILILLEVVHPSICETLECSLAISNCLNMRIDCLPNEYEAFVAAGFMSIERTISDANRSWAETTVDFFRQQKLCRAVKAYLFINQQLISHSRDGHTSVFDLLSDIRLSPAVPATD